MERILITDEEARTKVREGITKAAKAVSDTLGPFGNNALIEHGTRITNDGAKILKEITFEDEVEDLGLRKLKEAVTKSNDIVGDGSTTITTLTAAILKEGSRNLKGRTTTADFLKKLAEEREDINTKLDAMATPIETEEQLIEAATVSVDDKELGRIIGETQWKLGKDGFILAEESNDRTTSVEILQGIRIDNGLGMTQIVNNMEKQSLELEDVRTILTDHTLQSLEPLKEVLNQLLKSKVYKVVIIARGFAEQAIKDCAQNIQGGFQIYPINAPYTDSREVMLDLQAVLGGQFMDHEMHALEDMQLSDVGFAEKISARRFDAVITGKNPEKVAARVKKLKEQLTGSESEFESRALKSRIAQLENGFALITVGAESETERKRLFDKVEDAVHAVRAAFQEGTVKGAGLAFKEIAETLPEGSILKNPLASINLQLMANAPEDFQVEDWVRDPVKVLKVALEQAVSVGGNLATISSVITTKKEKYNAYVKTT